MSFYLFIKKIKIKISPPPPKKKKLFLLFLSKSKIRSWVIKVDSPPPQMPLEAYRVIAASNL